MLEDKKTQGAWIIHHTGKLQQVTSQDTFVNLYTSGKAGLLLSAISASEQSSLSTSQVENLARSTNINIKLELPELIRKLERSRLIETSGNGLEVLGLTTVHTLEHTASIFNQEEPNNIERASLALAEIASDAPVLESEIQERLQDEYKLSKLELTTLFADATIINLVDSEAYSGRDRIYFNGNLFRSNDIEKTKRVLDSLTPSDRILVNEVNEIFAAEVCISADRVRKILGDKLFEKLNSIGFYDVNVIKNSTENVAYVTRPATFTKYSNPAVDDAFDNAKALVASLTYGMSRSSYARGNIRLVDKLLDKLIRGEWVGPVKAIGEDYRALEYRRVVEVKESATRYGQAYSMRLLKKEVGELAKQAILGKDASEHSIDSFPEAAVSRYIGPETNREITRRKSNDIPENTLFEILSSLRPKI